MSKSWSSLFPARTAAARCAAGILSLSLGLSVAGMFAPSAQAAPIYWDTNGTTAGAGATPTGTWDNGGAANWNTTLAGDTTTPAVWTNSLTTNTSVFSAGTDAVNPYTVTVSGTVQTAGITVEDGTLILAGTSTPVIQIGTTGITINNTVAGAATLDSTLGTVTVAGAQSWTNNSAQVFSVNSGVSTDGTSRVLTVVGSNAGGTNFSGLLSNNGAGTLTILVNTTGSTTTTFSNANNTFGSGAAGITIGANGTARVRATATQALGNGQITIDTTGNAVTSRLEMTSGISLNNAIVFGGRGAATNAIFLNVSGNNTLSGTVAGQTGGVNYNFQSDSGTLTLGTAAATAITSNATGARAANFLGAGDFAVAGNIVNGTATMTVSKTGSGTLILSGTNTYTGGTGINGGVVALGSGVQALGGSGTVGTVGTITWSGGTLQFSASNTTDYSSRFSEASSSAYKLDTNGQTVAWGTGRTPTGTGSLTKSGAGTLNITTASNGWTGATTIEAGIVQVNALGAINTNSSIGKGSSVGSAADLVFGGGTLRYAGSTATTTNRVFTIGDANGLTATLDASGTGVGTMSFTGTGSLGLGGSGARTLTLTGSNTGNNTLASVIGDGSGGTTALTKSGAGTWVIFGTSANTYSGLSTITLGELDLNKTVGVDAVAGNILINGGTLKLLASNQINDTSTISQTSGAFNLNGQAETVTSYTKSGGTFRTGVGGSFTGTGASMTFDGAGSNIVDADSTVQDVHLVLQAGATVHVYSTSDSGSGSAGGILQLNASGIGLELQGTAGNTINLYSGTNSTTASKFILKGDVTTAGTGLNTITAIDGVASTTKGIVDLDGGTRTFTVADTVSGSGNDLLVSAALTNGGLTKAGAGTMTISGENTFTGATTIGTVGAGAANITSATANGGTLVAEAVNALQSTSAIAVNNGGTLLLSGSGSIDRVNNSAAITLGTTGGSGVGGTLSMAGVSNSSEIFGTLTLSSDSTLDFGAGTGNTMTFSGLTLGAFTLSIYNWSGNPNVADPDTGAEVTQDRLLFTTGGFSTAQLSQMIFYADSGSGLLGTGREISFSGTPEIVPVPEPATVFGALGLLGLVGGREWRRRRR